MKYVLNHCSTRNNHTLGYALSLLLLALLFYTCQPAKPETTVQVDESIAKDPHSYARPWEAVAEHLDLSLKVDFDSQTLSGLASYRIKRHAGDSIVFDVKGLVIESVSLDSTGKAAGYSLSQPDPILGSALSIAVGQNTRSVQIHYRTTPEGAQALGWLTPAQTHDKKLPFLYTQGQAILTRTWIPVQDSPGLRISYHAHIEVPKGMLAVMSATNPQVKSPDGQYDFDMSIPIPPYLIALSVGDIGFKAISDRTGVYAEPGMLEAAAYELVDLEKMVATAEALYGPYLWGRFDLIVLPPSFPFGGMENPKLTFATPTIIAGDRSLVSLVAHELAHSWSGNLVTNATWNDFWLNEGFTTYIENRIMEALYGAEYARMLALLGYQDLVADVKDMGPDNPDTRLLLDLSGRDPDEGVTDIAYEKGAHFLRLIEQKVGRQRFDAFIKSYFADHRFESMTTARFEQYLAQKLGDPGFDTKAWIHQPGLPDNIPMAISDRFSQVDVIRQKYLSGTTAAALPTREWSTHEWLHFIRGLPYDLPEAKMLELDQNFNLTASGNSEILAAWFELSIRNHYSIRIMSRIEDFLRQVGRRKFLMPLYRAMVESGQKEDAKRIYLIARDGYHAVSRGSLEELLKE